MTRSFGISAKEQRAIGRVKMKHGKDASAECADHIHMVAFALMYRYECPAGCLDATGKVVGTVYYEMVSAHVAGLRSGKIKKLVHEVAI